MRVLIPACGLGERFKSAGYDVVKPLIPINGRPMIDRVIEALRLQTLVDEYFIITNWDDGDVPHPTVHLDGTTVGATETVLKALGKVPPPHDCSILLLDCDAIYDCDVITKFRELEANPQIRAGVLCFTEKDAEKHMKPKYSYVQANADGEVAKIAEKIRIGPLANTGAYWFASVTEFQEAAEDVMRNGKFQVGEAYISSVLQEYLISGKTIKAVVIDEEEYSNVGTPNGLELYLRKHGGFTFLFDLDGTLIDTTSAYVKAWDKLLGCKGAFVDEDFFIGQISGLSDAQVVEKFKISVSSAEKDEELLKHINSLQEIKGAKEFLRKCQKIGFVYIVTNSNRAAAVALLNHLELNDIPLIAAEDVHNGKPNPEPYAKAMRRLGVSPSNCLVFEDSRGGLISGRAASCRYIIAISNNLTGCDAFLPDFHEVDPQMLLESLESVTHLSEELSERLGQAAKVYPVRASGGYISEILSASCGSKKLVLKQEHHDHGVLQDVSEFLNLHRTECIFYENFAQICPLRTPTFYGVLPKSQAIVMEDLRKYDRPPAFSIESGLKVVNAIATFHSHFRGAPLGELSAHKTYMQQHVQKNYNAFKTKWRGTLSAATFELFDHAFEFYEHAEAQLLSHPRTLLHGDLKFPNIFWDYAVSGGEPIFIDWQYAGPGKGIEDIVFLLVESCDLDNFEDLAITLTNAYYDRIQHLDDIEVPPVERKAQISCALAGFPFFVAVWFGCIDASKLSEKNFPFLYILRLANAFSKLYDIGWVQCTV